MVRLFWIRVSTCRQIQLCTFEMSFVFLPTCLHSFFEHFFVQQIASHFVQHQNEEADSDAGLAKELVAYVKLMECPCPIGSVASDAVSVPDRREVDENEAEDGRLKVEWQ
jgi:hypothetical protein